MRKIGLLFFLLASLLRAATSVTQYGMTLNLDTNYTTGQYANGDYWILENTPGGGVKVNTISPASTYTINTSAVTISNGSPAVVTWTAHGLPNFSMVRFTTTGALPTGLTAGTVYYVRNAATDSFNLAGSDSSSGGLIATTSAGSGTHTGTFTRTINGAMVNPTAGLSVSQGFDSAMGSNTFDSTLNAARNYNNTDLSSGNQLSLAAGSSIVCSISDTTSTTTHPIGAGKEPQLTDAAVFTVVASAPASGQFRPPYCGSDKTSTAVTHNKSQIDYTIFGSRTPVLNAPVSMSDVDGVFARAVLEINTQFSGGYLRPSNNGPNYGREIAFNAETLALALCLNFTNAQKETGAIRLIQYGIDCYGSAVSGAEWRNNGGWNLGRKLPVVVAGLALNDTAIKFYGDKANFYKFQEDQQTLYVPSGYIGMTVDDQYVTNGRLRLTAATGMLNLADWNITGVADGSPSNYGANWGVVYRNTNYAPGVGTALAAQLITGARILWNWQPFFDFMDRAMYVRGTSSPDVTTFTANMWTAYRATGGTVYTPPLPVPIRGWIPEAGTTINIEFTGNISTGAGGNGGIVLTSTGGAITVTGTPTGAGTTVRTWGLSRVPLSNEVITIAYTQPGSGLRNTNSGTDIVSFSGAAVNNYSGSPPPPIPNPPTNLVATVVSSYQINLTWTDNSGGTSTAQIEQSLDGASWVNIANVPADPPAYNVTGLTIATTYYYRVRCSNAGGNSAYSTAGPVLTITPSAAPANFRRQGLLGASHP